MEQRGSEVKSMHCATAKFEAHRLSDETWLVEWLPGRALTYAQAAEAMTIADVLTVAFKVAGPEVKRNAQYPGEHVEYDLADMADSIGLTADEMVTAWKAANAG